jgi:hypothetical protein
LSDSESYVYLAAIQCIVAAADLNPSKVLPLVGFALASGVLAITEDGNTELELTSEQRVKLGEALIFSIRRRARIDEFITTLMDLMIFGGKSGNPEGSDAKTVDRMQKETQDYFFMRETDTEAGNGNDEDDLEEKEERQYLRVNTGGPLFRSEEADVVTAARITVVSELVSASRPAVVSKYCTSVLRIAIESLRLDSSRPVRRAAAFLAREIYHSLIREYYDMIDMISGTGDDDEISTDLALATAMTSSKDDEALAAALQRCLSAEDLGDVSESKYRLFDAATVARCEEALGSRQEAVDGGLLVVARMIADSKKLESGTPAVRVIRDLLKQRGSQQVVAAAEGLKIDTETLEFK